eukprot:449597-Prymnesium_polylepis.1
MALGEPLMSRERMSSCSGRWRRTPAECTRRCRRAALCTLRARARARTGTGTFSSWHGRGPGGGPGRAANFGVGAHVLHVNIVAVSPGSQADMGLAEDREG